MRLRTLFAKGVDQGQYQQQGKYGGPIQKYGGRILQPYKSISQQYVRSSNYQGFHGPSKNVKIYNNWNYCHTHGFDVKDDHDSSNCRNPSWKYNCQATRENTMGGSQRNKFTAYLPSQVPKLSPPQN